MYKLDAKGGEPVVVDTGEVNRVNNDHGISPDGKLFVISAGHMYTLPSSGGTPTQITKLTGGGLETFSYYTAALIWPDPDDADVFWAVILYRCLNRGGLTFGLGRTRDSAASVTLTGRAVSGRTAGDRLTAAISADGVPRPAMPGSRPG